MTSKKRKRGPKTGTVRLGDRDRSILRFVARNRLATPDLLYQTFFPGKGWAASTSVLRRLLGRGPTYRYLRPQKLDGTHVAYRLTRRGCRELGVSEKLARPVGPRAKIERLATAAFLLAGRGARTPIHGKKLRTFLGLDPGERLPKPAFYLEEDKGVVGMGVILIDCGGHSRGIATRTVRKLSGYLDRHWFDAELQAGGIAVTILTGRRSKVASLLKHVAEAIDEDLRLPVGLLRRGAEPGDLFRLKVVHVPEIEFLLPGRTDHKNNTPQRKQP